MNERPQQLHTINDEQLLENLSQLLRQDRGLEASLLEYIGELDRRKLYRERAYSSMYQFCLDELHLSEAMAYRRITVARAARRFPRLLGKIQNGELHLTGAALLAGHLEPHNERELLAAATHKSKRKIEQMLAERFPKPAVPETIRKLPAPATKVPSAGSPPSSGQPLDATEAPSPRYNKGASCHNDSHEHEESSNSSTTNANQKFRNRRESFVVPLAADRYKVQLTVDGEFVAALQKAQELLGPRVGSRDLAFLLGRALDLLVGDLEKRKHGVTSRPRESPKSKSPKSPEGFRDVRRSRYIPKSVLRRVYDRDAGQCAYVSARGKRCKTRSGLEYHHRIPFAHGGDSTEANLQLLCKCHNALAAEQDFGPEKMRRHQNSDGTNLPQSISGTYADPVDHNATRDLFVREQQAFYTPQLSNCSRKQDVLSRLSSPTTSNVVCP